MSDKEEKFLVIKLDKLTELNENHSGAGMFLDCPPVKQLHLALSEFERSYTECTGKKLDNKYIVCNQDEPYADKVWDIILQGEDQKGG